MRYTTFFLALFTFFTLSSVSADREISFEERKNFIENYTDIAIKEMLRTGVPASITLAQFILESNWGRGELFRNANAGFGIKCKSSWSGDTYYLKDDDFRGEQLIESCFRKYPSVEATFIDHSNFLKNRSYYESLFFLERNDYKGWAHGLKRCQYATDVEYPEKLIKLIETYDLYVYDYEKENTPVYVETSPQREEIVSAPVVPQSTLTFPVIRSSKPQTTSSQPTKEPTMPSYQGVEYPRVNTTTIPTKVRKKRHVAYKVKPRHRRPGATHRP